MYGTGTGNRTVALTFDDGPHPTNTPKLLDALKLAGIHATFFMLGQNLATSAGKAILARAAAEGHQIGNHTYTHPDLTKLSEQQVRDEILKTEVLIGSAMGQHKLLRPPYGAHNSTIDKVAKDLGYTLVLWNVDSMDWHPKYRDGQWVEHAMDQIEHREHCVVLAHDIHPTTVCKVDELITKINQLPNTTFMQYA